jgi:hypothetical protein
MLSKVIQFSDTGYSFIKIVIVRNIAAFDKFRLVSLEENAMISKSFDKLLSVRLHRSSRTVNVLLKSSFKNNAKFWIVEFISTPCFHCKIFTFQMVLFGIFLLSDSLGPNINPLQDHPDSNVHRV